MTPDVIDGARTPRAERNAEAATTKRQAGRTIPDGKVVFQARGARYRLQLTAPDDQKLPDGRILKGKQAKVAIFDEYFLTLDEKKDAEKIQMIRDHQDFGLDFWDFSSTLARIQERRVEEAVKTFQDADPDSKKAILAALAASTDDDFKVPGAAKAGDKK